MVIAKLRTAVSSSDLRKARKHARSDFFRRRFYREIYDHLSKKNLPTPDPPSYLLRPFLEEKIRPESVSVETLVKPLEKIAEADLRFFHKINVRFPVILSGVIIVAGFITQFVSKPKAPILIAIGTALLCYSVLYNIVKEKCCDIGRIDFRDYLKEVTTYRQAIKSANTELAKK